MGAVKAMAIELEAECFEQGDSIAFRRGMLAAIRLANDAMWAAIGRPEGTDPLTVKAVANSAVFGAIEHLNSVAQQELSDDLDRIEERLASLEALLRI
jgi:hypothetical protein